MNTTTKRGRKINENLTKYLYLDVNTKSVIGRGRPKANRRVLRVEVQRNVKGTNFNYNTTPFKNAVEMVTAGKAKAKSSVSVTVIEPDAPEVESESSNSVS